jgi:DNA (cytosine-5)-methyltransferase 1
MSPHHFGIPQHRERVIIMGVRADIASEELPITPELKPQPTSIEEILDDGLAPPETYLSAQDIELLNHWEKFVQHFKVKGIKLPTFPLWTDDWTSSYTTEGLPDWKAKFIKQNREFYVEHRAEFLENWLKGAKQIAQFKGAKAKFEWQSGNFQADDSIWNLLFQYRPSGIRVKRATYSPALVALAQIVYVGSKKRKLSPREVARLQSFPETFKLPASHSEAYKQFGNAVNVEVIRQAALHMFSMAEVSEA